MKTNRSEYRANWEMSRKTNEQNKMEAWLEVNRRALELRRQRAKAAGNLEWWRVK